MKPKTIYQQYNENNYGVVEREGGREGGREGEREREQKDYQYNKANYDGLLEKKTNKNKRTKKETTKKGENLEVY